MAELIHFFMNLYVFLILLRITSSWFPEWANHPWIQSIAKVTDPYLDLFRRIIPPIGGTVDLSPTVAIIVLWFIERLLMYGF